MKNPSKLAVLIDCRGTAEMLKPFVDRHHKILMAVVIWSEDQNIEMPVKIDDGDLATLVEQCPYATFDRPVEYDIADNKHPIKHYYIKVTVRKHDTQTKT